MESGAKEEETFQRWSQVPRRKKHSIVGIRYMYQGGISIPEDGSGTRRNKHLRGGIRCLGGISIPEERSGTRRNKHLRGGIRCLGRISIQEDGSGAKEE
jgi:hypothetical protein